MNVNLTPELEGFVRVRVQSGKYEEAKAASVAFLKGALKEGLIDLEEGRVYDGPQVLEELKAELRVSAG